MTDEPKLRCLECHSDMPFKRFKKDICRACDIRHEQKRMLDNICDYLKWEIEVGRVEMSNDFDMIKEFLDWWKKEQAR